MIGKQLMVVLAVTCLLSAAAVADVTTVRVGSQSRSVGRLRITGGEGNPTWTIEADLSALPKDAKIYRARLHASRSEPMSGRDDWALSDIVIRPVMLRQTESPAALKLVAPWYDCFDATEAVGQMLKGNCRGLSVEVFPKLEPRNVYLDVEYEGKPARPPKQAGGLRVFHRAGQTFITWKEIDPRITQGQVTWGALRKALEEMDAKGEVRYRLYRHDQPITAANLAAAEPLAEAKPLSCYNVEGRSLEKLIVMHRRRAIEDIGFARKLAREDYFSRYRINMPEMEEVIVDRFVIDEPAGGPSGEPAKPLPAGCGLYVHNSSKAGKAYYAVVTAINGLANTVEFSEANATSQPLQETVGHGEPVFQAAGTLKVFYDYPGQRRYYVQWTAPPLSHLPNQYYNWAVYVPRDPPKPTPIRMAFTGDRYMKPGVPHRDDTILISGQDQAIWSNWWGYHEALGTLRSLRQGHVQPFTQRRLFAFLDWAVRAFAGDAKRLSCEGGTDALYYGVRHGDRFAYVITHSPDPDPQTTAAVVKAQNYTRRTARPQMENAWGNVEFGCTLPDGQKVWDHMNLTRYVAESPKAEVAFLSMGPAMLSAPWPNQVEFMKQMWASAQPYCAQFFWGGGEPVRVPEGRIGQAGTWDFALDLPMLALRNNSNDMFLDSKQFTEGVHGYGSGGRIAAGRRWLSDAVDQAERFEITIHGGGDVVYAGGGASDVTPRRLHNFKPAPGQKYRWENVELKGGKVLQSGEVIADPNGLVIVPQVQFAAPSRLKVFKAEADAKEK